ncbi:hypothetical protein GCM10025789_30960 [Tessaracoccus lubricantis]|uniref:Uncharacterized protein n=1 Tax=Tessaracoccus lubricantis TaxID=545543 RepID=A0ABP9FP57_9ACTN
MVDNMAMGQVFEHLIFRFSTASNETAGEHFTPQMNPPNADMYVPLAETESQIGGHGGYGLLEHLRGTAEGSAASSTTSPDAYSTRAGSDP